MATNCPSCGKKLKWYNIKAECIHCGVNIPNYNWEARLEEDNKIAEAKFASLYAKLNMLKYSVFGTKLRIVRILMSLIPAVGFILPWAYVASEKDNLNFDLLGLFTDGTNTLKFFGTFFKNIGGILSNLEGPVLYIIGGFLLTLLSIVAIVIAFFLIFIMFRRPKTNATWIADFISILLAGAAAAMFIMAGSPAKGAENFAIADLEFVNASAGAMWGIFVYIGLLVVALIGNLLVSRADVTSEEDLEEAARKKKEEAWIEAEKKKEEEQAEKVRKAKEALEKSEKK